MSTAIRDVGETLIDLLQKRPNRHHTRRADRSAVAGRSKRGRCSPHAVLVLNRPNWRA